MEAMISFVDAYRDKHGVEPETLAWQSFLRQTLSHVDTPPSSGSNTRSL